jgi:hypothetical protein
MLESSTTGARDVPARSSPSKDCTLVKEGFSIALGLDFDVL